MANSQVAAWSSDKINTYDELPIATFDNTVRLIRGTVGNLTFANGTLKAATGSISNDGIGSGLIIVNVGDTWDFSTLYTTNTIYSNSVFTIKTAYPAPAANATFSYAT